MAKRFDDRPGGDRPRRGNSDRNDRPRRDDGPRPNRPAGGSSFRPGRPDGNRPTGGRPTGSRPGGFSSRRDSEPRGDFRNDDRRGNGTARGPRREGGDFNERPFPPRKQHGGPRPEGGDRPNRPGSGPRKPYGAKPAFGRKPDFNRDDRRRDDRPEGELRRFGNDDRRGDDRRGDDRRSGFGEKKFGDKKPFQKGPRPVFDKKRFDGDARGDKPFGAKPFKKFGDKPAFDKPRFRPDGDRPAPHREGEGFGPKKPLFKSRNHRDEADGRTPSYDFDRFKEAAPKRIQKKIKDEERDTIRLNRYIANAGVCSRRDADSLIEAGEIKVNGKVITEMGYQVKPGDVVKYGNRVLNPEKMLYVLLNKPKDFITTTDDPNDRRTVMDLVKNAGPQRIYPVGRLDRNTTGLLLLTNDGELAEKLTHPSYQIRKMYQAELDKPISTEDFEKLREGIELEDGFIKPDDLAIVTPDAQVIGIEIHSGRNRIVRRMFEALGYEVTKLDRTVYASLDKKDLPRGNWRYLTEKEVIKLKYF
jgi:23S rRNA pseudouridine2605 synthase